MALILPNVSYSLPGNFTLCTNYFTCLALDGYLLCDTVLSSLSSYISTHYSLHQCVHFTYGPGVESIHGMVCRTKASLANYNNVLHMVQVLGNDPLKSVAIIHLIVFALHKSGGVESTRNLVCRTKAVLANHSHVSRVGWALGDSRPVLALPTSHASILLIFFVCLSNCMPEPVFSTPVGTANKVPMKRLQTNSQF